MRPASRSAISSGLLIGSIPLTLSYRDLSKDLGIEGIESHTPRSGRCARVFIPRSG